MSRHKDETRSEKNAQPREPGRTPGLAEGDERTIEKALRNAEKQNKK